MPKRRNFTREQDNITKERLLGKIYLFLNLKNKIEEDQEILKEYREDLIALLAKLPKNHEGNHVYDDGDISAVLENQEREYFNLPSALDVLNTLDPAVAKKYMFETTDKEQLASAFLQKKITAKQLDSVTDKKEVQVLRVKERT